MSFSNDGEIFLGVIVDVLALDKTGLATNLGGDFVVRKTRGGEKGQPTYAIENPNLIS